MTFFPIFVFSAIPLVWSYVEFREAGFTAFRFCMIIFAFCSALFYWSAVWTDRQKISVISENSDTNMNFARAKKWIWKRFWLICGWSNTGYIWFVLGCMYVRNYAMTILLLASIIYGIEIMFVALWMVKKIRELNQKYEEKRTISSDVFTALLPFDMFRYFSV